MTAFGVDLAEMLKRAAKKRYVIYLEGELGAGKTTLVRGLLKGLGYNGKVKSPTFTIVEPYQIGKQVVYHFDLYRLNDPEELEYIGARDYFAASAIILIEWPGKAEKNLPEADLICRIVFIDKKPEQRIVTCD